MMEFSFTPTEGRGEIHVPFLEDARADFAPYYDVRGKSIDKAQTEVITELAKLGAGGVMFQAGYFGTGKDRRYGYNITFSYGGGQGIIRVAGLPIKLQHTDRKIEKARLQALMNVRDWLKGAVTTRVFSPGSDVLIPFMIVAHTSGKAYTVADYIRSMGELPQLNPGPSVEVFEGEIID